MGSLIPFALFSKKVYADGKSSLVTRIRGFSPKSDSAQLGKPRLQVNINNSTSLQDLVGPRSLAFWDILGLGHQWLEQQPSQWEDDPDYRQARDYVHTVKVTNDLVECGVKVSYSSLFSKMSLCPINTISRSCSVP